MQQRVPCESDWQFLEVTLRREVILAAATALWSGNIDCTHPSSGAILDANDRRSGEDVAVVVGLGMDEVRMLDLIADLMDEIDALWAILLHAEAIDDEIGSERRNENSAEKGLGFCDLQWELTKLLGENLGLRLKWA